LWLLLLLLLYILLLIPAHYVLILCNPEVLATKRKRLRSGDTSLKVKIKTANKMSIRISPGSAAET